jgi:hypothetical protein
MQQNEDGNVVKRETSFTNDATRTISYFKNSRIYHAKNTHDKRTACKVQNAIYSSYGTLGSIP